jgi:hypothetical protein
MGSGSENVALITINAESDGPWSVVTDCSVALGLMLAMESAHRLDNGQRVMVEQAVALLDSVAGEIGP